MRKRYHNFNAGCHNRLQDVISFLKNKNILVIQNFQMKKSKLQPLNARWKMIGQNCAFYIMTSWIIL